MIPIATKRGSDPAALLQCFFENVRLAVATSMVAENQTYFVLWHVADWFASVYVHSFVQYK